MIFKNKIIFTISIVSHNHKHEIEKIIEDIKKFNDKDKFEVIITSNAKENFDEYVNDPDLQIIIIYNNTPKGFGANHNKAINRAIGEFYFIINPDVRIENNIFEKISEFLGDKKIGCCAPLVHDSFGNIQDSNRSYPTVTNLTKRWFLRKKINDYLGITKPVIYVDWTAGMFMGFHRDNWKKINGFDESYFMYGEDVDICFRLNKSSMQVAVLPMLSIVHDGRRESRKNLRFLFWHISSLCRFWKKYYIGQYINIFNK